MPAASGCGSRSAVAALADEAVTDWWTARRRAVMGTTPPLQGPDVAAWRRSWALPRAPPPARFRLRLRWGRVAAPGPAQGAGTDRDPSTRERVPSASVVPT